MSNSKTENKTIKKTNSRKKSSASTSTSKRTKQTRTSKSSSKTTPKATANKAKIIEPTSRAERFFNRELSWLEFNNRILHEARDKNNPLLERIKFLSITASNLDEFYIVRVASLRDMQSVDMSSKDIAGMTVNEQIAAIDSKTRGLMQLMYSTYNRSLVPLLSSSGIKMLDYSELSKEDKKVCDEYFHVYLYPILTPMAVDSSRPFPLIHNRMLNMCVMLKDAESPSRMGKDAKDDEKDFVTLQIPTIVPRMYQLSHEDGTEIFVPIEQIIQANLDTLFVGQEVIASGCYRVMRNADLDIDEDEAEDLLKEIEEQVRKRRFGEIIRIEVDENIDSELLDFIIRELEISHTDIFSVNGPIDLTFLMKVYGALDDKFPSLCYPSHKPALPSSFNDGYDNIFEKIKAKDRIVHHPYESFDPVLEFVKQAATDPNVLAIKQTLYRVSSKSPIIASLLEAARNGKQVMVLVELKARFDEENNINWAKMLEKAGCHVIYGLVGLKTHSKITLIVRKEEDGICRYLHLATGNYNDITAKIYTDMGLFTASESMGEDASEFFNMLSGFSIPNNWHRLVPAPLWMKNEFLKRIGRETQNARDGKEARIIAKINSLVDEVIIEALYEASKAGVKIDLIVRGICCLRPGVPGMSENISVRSITGRFLEHSRIFYFYNEGHEDLFMASADWMPRNLNRRVELLFPIEDSDCRARVMEVLNVELEDTIRASLLNSDGTYHKQDLRGKEKHDSQEELIKFALDLEKEITEKEINNMAFVPKTAPSAN